jgi:2-polyprenyl-3-methyl-5-hydroxy-6-metoxy-1,4-benzoquinol methylase
MQEVHRWRGADEQRAMRGQVRKLGQFAYFDHQLGGPDWSGLQVLDFGGTDGNLLWNPDCAIGQEHYTCLDVVCDAIEEGRRTFPRAHWVHYDRYNCSFNPDGVPRLPVPDLRTRFDVILAYSVFTHTTREEMHELVAQLLTHLTRDGVLAFTFEDPRRNLTGPLLQRSRGAAWCAVVDGKTLFLEDDGRWTGESERCMTYDVYYTPEQMQREFPNAQVLEPVNGEPQHCCVIRATKT